MCRSALAVCLPLVMLSALFCVGGLSTAYVSFCVGGLSTAYVSFCVNMSTAYVLLCHIVSVACVCVADSGSSRTHSGVPFAASQWRQNFQNCALLFANLLCQMPKLLLPLGSSERFVRQLQHLQKLQEHKLHRDHHKQLHLPKLMLSLRMLKLLPPIPEILLHQRLHQNLHQLQPVSANCVQLSWTRLGKAFGL